MRTSFLLTLAAACAVIAAPAPSEKDLAERSADVPQVVDAPLWARADNSSASNSTSDNSNNNSNNSNNSNDNSNNNKNSNKNNNKNNNNNNNVQITEVTETETVIEQNSKSKEETLFEKKVTKLVVKNQSSNNKKNDKRANNAKNKDNTKTTVIQVVQEIIEVKQDGSKGKRYAMSKITANAGQNATQSAQMTDAQTMTVGSCAANATDVATATAADASATGAVAAGATGDVSAPYLQSNQTQLLASGAAAPGAAAEVMLMDDSASDISSDELNQC